MKIIARKFLIDEFKDYVEHIRFNGWTPNFVVVHNTSSPDQKLYKEWHSRKNWTQEQWLNNLTSFYKGMGWDGTPHLFVAYDYIMVLNDLTIHGTHSPSWNKFSWGVETVAEFDHEPFDNGVRTNLIAALAILHSRIGLNPADFKLDVRGLHFHKEDKATTHKNCPGKNLVKPQLVKDVVAYMNSDGNDLHTHDISIASQSADTSPLTVFELTSVSWLQTQLNKKGFNLTLNSQLDKDTKAAVREYQAKNNLHIDGIAGPITRLSLKGN